MKKLWPCVLLMLSPAVVAAGPAREAITTRNAPGSPSLAQAQGTRTPPAAAQRIAGAWDLESRTVKRADGSVVDDPVLGQRPLGRLFYDASGVVMLQMMRLGRKAAIGTPVNPKDGANARVVLGYDAYFGRFSIDERAGTITHYVEASLFPEDLGKDFVRNFALEGDTWPLSFTSPAEGTQITRTLRFRRHRP